MPLKITQLLINKINPDKFFLLLLCMLSCIASAGNDTLKTKDKVITPEDEQKLLSEIIQRYEKQTSPYYAAARLWVDDIIDPADTRKIISESIAAANNNNEISDFKTGVFQV